MTYQETGSKETVPTSRLNLDDSDDEPSLRVAIVGGGPRGLYSLERILDKARQLPATHLHVTLYDSSGQPGAGKIYSTKQPEWLLMNYSSRHIDAWL
ncbi:MAG: hypothetical protein CMJ46_00835, partial [Planctomyces sp.]|nr:hypothetical protein [Planctomyces sp.]